ncbi:general stress protein [Rhizobium sp. PL01]|uniref:general stress protein n=1 Tax=Rhizobium sp. PL01 TaxID=3085631 RepID=UPI002980B6D1|nr:general stress protein [Rhizobium sp. PL01]MDW5315430.1 general stress protein [Rhizobium sp. PL01]
MTKTVTGLFDTYSDATAAVDQLKTAGISEKDISIVSNNADGRHKSDNDVAEDAGAGAGIGAAVGGVGGLLTGLGIMAIPGVGPVVAAGWLAATAAGAVAGAVVGGAAGGIIGALTDSGVDERDAHVYAEGVRRGGTLVTAKVDEARAVEAEAILKRSNWVDLPARRSAYEGQGWSGFDDTSKPYTQAEIDADRARYAGRAL